jgi:nicotinate-nucleotide pyrophosphorylase (carboxylating)
VRLKPTKPTRQLSEIASVLGSITTAIKNARRAGGFTLLLEVEVQSEAEADEAVDAGADIIMLDNMDGGQLADVSKRLKEKWSGKRKFLFESSGNITESNLHERAIDGEALSLIVICPMLSSFITNLFPHAGIDILSTSVVHQSAQHIDFSLKIQKSN